jgi:deoxyribose-phosphate aldolase
MNIHELAVLIEISTVQSNHSVEDVLEAARLAKKYGFAVVYSLPAYTKALADYLKGCSYVAVGGNISFPYGAELLETKLYMADQIIRDGAQEIDMVLNIGDLRMGEYDKISKEILAIKKRVGTKPLKVIFEVSYLSCDQIRKASELALDAGADYIKTATGWIPKPTTDEQIDIMLEVMREKGHGKVKAAGGIRGLDILTKMYKKGVSRFGIRDVAAMDILSEAKRRWGEV